MQIGSLLISHKLFWFLTNDIQFVNGKSLKYSFIHLFGQITKQSLRNFEP